MKNLKFALVSALFCWLTLASGAQAESNTLPYDSLNQDNTLSDGSWVLAKLPAKRVKVRLSDAAITSSKDSNLWVSLYGGTDLSVLGDISTTTKDFADAINTQGGTATHNTDHLGFLGGMELGLDLDKENSISLSVENTWTPYQSMSAEGLIQNFGPSLLGVSVNYSRAIIHDSGSKMSFTAGLGYYHASLDYFSNVEDNFAGNFDGEVLGGTLGINEELSLGGDFSLTLAAKGRIANFSTLTSNNLSVNGAPQKGAFNLITVPEGPGANFVLPNPVGEPFPPFIGTTQLDYSGFEGTIAASLAL